jgi:hypothetical protein
MGRASLLESLERVHAAALLPYPEAPRVPRRGLVERSRQGHPPEGSDGGVLAASGLVAGEGLAGVLVAALVALGVAPKGRPPFVAGLPGEALTTLGILAVCAFLYRAGAKRGA